MRITVAISFDVDSKPITAVPGSIGLDSTKWEYETSYSQSTHRSIEEETVDRTFARERNASFDA